MAYGVFQKLAIETSHLTPANLTNRLDFTGGTIGLIEEFINANGLRGTRSHDISKEMMSLRRVQGNLSFLPTITEIRTLFPWMLGTAESGAGSSGSPWTYALADTLLSRWITVDRGDNRFEYTSCVVDSWTLEASKGGGLSFDLDIVGFDETVSSTAFKSSLTIDTASLGAFVFSNLVLTVAGTPYNLTDFRLNGANHIDRERFFNSATLTAANPTDRTITLSTQMPYTLATALYGLVGTSGAATVASTAPALVATFTNGLNVLTITLPKVAFPRRSPMPQGRGEIMLPIDLQAFCNGATLEMSTTLSTS